MKRLALLLLLVSSPVTAQPACGAYDDLILTLRTDYEEESRFVGLLSGARGVVEIYASPEGRTWSLIITGLDQFGRKMACLIYAGDMFYDPSVRATGEGR